MGGLGITAPSRVEAVAAAPAPQALVARDEAQTFSFRHRLDQNGMDRSLDRPRCREAVGVLHANDLAHRLVTNAAAIAALVGATRGCTGNADQRERPVSVVARAT